MKLLTYILLGTLLIACNNKPAPKETATTTEADTLTKAEPPKDSSYITANWNLPVDNIKQEGNFEDELPYDTFFVVIADTGLDYYVLHRKMFTLEKRMHLGIDTMGRFFHSDKRKIALDDHNEDELYAGEYYPRRFPSSEFSLEYMNYYREGSNEEDVMALVGGIYDDQRSADSIAGIMRKYEKKVFVQTARIYVGCMH